MIHIKQTKNLARLMVPVLAMLLLGQGCLFNFGGTRAAADGGVYKTFDRGAAWTQKAGVLSVGAAKSLTGVNVLTIFPDPSNVGVLYLGTAESGLFYSLDSGESWAQVGALAGNRIPSVAVDTKNPCVIYAVAANMAVKSTDCTRTWTESFRDTRADSIMNWIAVDHFNGQILYLATSKGDILKSVDAGASWLTVKVFPSAVVKIVIDPKDSRILYAGTRSSGIWKSTDSGANWTDVSAGLSEFGGAKDFYDLIADRSEANAYVLVSRYGLLRTVDGGEHWENVKLLTPAGQARIYSFASNPQNGQEMYYATATIFYASTNGGVNWTTKRLPTSRAGSALLVDSKNPATIYLGTLLLKK